MHASHPRAWAAAHVLLASSLLLGGCTSKTQSADSRLKAIYSAEWKWRDQQFPDSEDSQKPIQDHLPKVDPATQAMRLRTWEEVLHKLETIPRADLSPAEQLNFAVYRPQIETLIANQRFRDYEMPANSDTTFWTDLGYTARRPFRNLRDYRNWISQMHDIPRYFKEQIDEMRLGLKRGFTPPRVTMAGRDSRGQPLLHAVQGHAGRVRCGQDRVARAGGRGHSRYGAAGLSGPSYLHAHRIRPRHAHE